MKSPRPQVASILLFAWSGLIASAAPPYVNYQGLLNGADGQPLPTGNYTMQFSIYDQAQLGTRAWGPFIFDGAVAEGHGPLVPLVNGRFNVIIGPEDTNGVPISTAFANTNRFMEITVADGPPILPRQQFLSTPYAFEANNAQYAMIASNLVQAVADTFCPPGTIAAFGGHTNNIPPTWLLCDGRSVSRTSYARLFSVISNYWGSADGSSFNVPDLRGVFLRGVNLGRSDAYRDPETASRPPAYIGGSAGNMVGSVQANMFSSHVHQEHPGTGTTWFRQFQTWDGTWPNEAGGNVLGQTTGSTGGSETRPNNVYVNYIIKY